MRDLVDRLTSALHGGSPLAYCRLVETRGSTPQKAGATMLVFPDGAQAGTLGGGCVEAEVKRRALQVIQDGQPVVATFQLDSDYGWDDGLICGGRMQVVIRPVADDPTRHYFSQLAQRVAHGEGVTEAVVFDAQSSGLEAPAHYLFDTNGQFLDHLPGSPAVRADGPGAPAVVPSLLSELLRPLAARPRPYAARGIAFLPILPRCRLVIVGGGHVGKAVAELAADLDFAVWIVDDRADYASAERFPRAERRCHGPLDQVLPALEITADTYCLIVTRGHSHDEEALYFLADRGARYVGLIGSRRKIRLIFDDLKNEGIPVEKLRQVHAPVGLDIGSQTVSEIAVSICAELVAHRNLGTVPARPRPVDVS
ncbi:MAG: XdhC family protein [Pirellulales bacterium]